MTCLWIMALKDLPIWDRKSTRYWNRYICTDVPSRCRSRNIMYSKSFDFFLGIKVILHFILYFLSFFEPTHFSDIRCCITYIWFISFLPSIFYPLLHSYAILQLLSDTKNPSFFCHLFTMWQRNDILRGTQHKRVTHT